MKPIDDKKLETLIKEAELLSEADLKKALEEATANGVSLYQHLVDRSIITDENLGKLIASEYGTPYVSLRTKYIDKDVLKLIPEDFAKAQQIIAFEATPKEVKVATPYPDREDVICLVEKKTGRVAQKYFTTESELFEVLGKYSDDIKEKLDKLLKKQLQVAKTSPTDDKPVAEMLGILIEYAYQNNSSDIHIDPYEEELVIRFRMDGLLHDIATLPTGFLEHLVTRIKVMSRLRIDEHRAAQDGKLVQKMPQEDLDVRVSIVPTVHGEKVVMRLLSSKAQYISLEKLGLSEVNMKKVKVAYERPWGMILATGPTGCGKTTTLYSILQILNKRTVNIATIEDPVEYDIRGINQIQVNPKTNLTFAAGLRSILRQDPDIIMVGEIRDDETAGIAVNSAMTGHLVLSTVHTNNAATTPVRLQEMAVEPYLVASTLNIVIAQRLVRKICEFCRESYAVTKEEAALIGGAMDVPKHFGKPTVEGMRFYRGKGCKICKNSGYKGRTGLFEIMEISEELRRLIVTKANASELNEQAIKEGMTTMTKDGVSKIILGVTTVEEVLRVTKEG